MFRNVEEIFALLFQSTWSRIIILKSSRRDSKGNDRFETFGWNIIWNCFCRYLWIPQDFKILSYSSILSPSIIRFFFFTCYATAISYETRNPLVFNVSIYIIVRMDFDSLYFCHWITLVSARIKVSYTILFFSIPTFHHVYWISVYSAVLIASKFKPKVEKCWNLLKETIFQP